MNKKKENWVNTRDSFFQLVKKKEQLKSENKETHDIDKAVKYKPYVVDHLN